MIVMDILCLHDVGLGLPVPSLSHKSDYFASIDQWFSPHPRMKTVVQVAKSGGQAGHSLMIYSGQWGFLLARNKMSLWHGDESVLCVRQLCVTGMHIRVIF